MSSRKFSQRRRAFRTIAKRTGYTFSRILKEKFRLKRLEELYASN